MVGGFDPSKVEIKVPTDLHTLLFLSRLRYVLVDQNWITVGVGECQKCWPAGRFIGGDNGIQSALPQLLLDFMYILELGQSFFVPIPACLDSQ